MMRKKELGYKGLGYSKKISLVYINILKVHFEFKFLIPWHTNFPDIDPKWLKNINIPSRGLYRVSRIHEDNVNFYFFILFMIEP